MEGLGLPVSIRPRLNDPTADLAIRAWNLMGGEIQWPALEWVAEMFGITDLDLFVRQLVVIRDHQREEIA